MRIAVIGGGAAGFFAAISAKENHPQTEVVIIEKSQKVLSKVKISGGGRCNVTNGTTSISELAKGYPRGSKQLKKAFNVFDATATQTWFETRGVALYTQDDNRVFPKSNDSQTIITCLLHETKRLHVSLVLGVGVQAIYPSENGLELHYLNEQRAAEVYDKVIVATGGSPKLRRYDWLAKLGHRIEKPAPSLFTFNMPTENTQNLMGISVNHTVVSVQGTKLKASGPVLFTHWGMSGPAILKLSAFGARVLSEKDYNFIVSVNWTGENTYDAVLQTLRSIATRHAHKRVTNIKPFSLAERMWLFILNKTATNAHKKWSELSKKELNKLVNTLTNDEYSVKGKTTFKEEFVTCGGVSLKSVNFNTMESRACPGLYFAGEVLDIDGITGGYNFQAAWTTGFIAGKLN